MSSPPRKPEELWRADREKASSGEQDASKSSRNRTLKPQDAATLIIVDTTTGLPRILMGRRHPGQVFLPNKYVFPGGRADKIDRSVPSHDELEKREEAKLLLDMKGSASALRARGLAMAAVRETFEETGVLVGAEQPGALEQFGDGVDASGLGGWQGYLSQSVLPRLEPLTFLARAITPPGRPRRYDTRFFLVDASQIVRQVSPTDDELGDVGWFTIEELRQLDLPNITRAVVEDLNEYLAVREQGKSRWAVPFYYFKAGLFERVLLV